MLIQIATIVAPLFICAAIGFVWGRLDKPFNTEMITGLALNLGMPCLIFSTLTRLEVTPEAFAQMAGAYAVALASILFIGAVIVRLMRLEMRAFLPALAFSNTGNLGLPLCLFAFGELGLTFGICVFVIASISGFTIGIGIYSGRSSVDILYRNPMVYGIVAALAFMLANVRPPTWAANTTEIIGDLAIPLMLLSLGVAISKLKVEGVVRTFVFAAIKLGLGVAVGMAIAGLFGLSGPARGVLILQCAMPAAIHNYLFAQRFGRRPAEIASLVLISTTLVLISLPLLLLIVL